MFHTRCKYIFKYSSNKILKLSRDHADMCEMLTSAQEDLKLVSHTAYIFILREIIWRQMKEVAIGGNLF